MHIKKIIDDGHSGSKSVDLKVSFRILQLKEVGQTSASWRFAQLQAVEQTSAESSKLTKDGKPERLRAGDHGRTGNSWGRRLIPRTHRLTTVFADSLPARETHRFSRNRTRPDDFRQTGLRHARFNQR